MSELRVRLPSSIERNLRKVAKQDEVSVNQFIATAIAEKLAALQTAELLKSRGKRASRKKFEAALAQVPDTPPLPEDRID
jgi:hypothetical protein